MMPKRDAKFAITRLMIGTPSSAIPRSAMNSATSDRVRVNAARTASKLCQLEVTAIASRKLLQKFCDIRSPQGTLRQILVAQGLLSRLNHHVTSISYSAHLAFHDL